MSTVIDFNEEDEQYYVSVATDSSNKYTFIMEREGYSGAVVRSIVIDGFTVGASTAMKEAFGEARRYLCESVDVIQDVWYPSTATVVFDNE